MVIGAAAKMEDLIGVAGLVLSYLVLVGLPAVEVDTLCSVEGSSYTKTSV